jgi:preprotein translocase subunit SecY
MQMGNNLLSNGGLEELKKRILFLLGALVVYRFGAHIPVPGLDPNGLSKIFAGNQNIFSLFDHFSGGALSRVTIFALGVMPYISASIIIQLLSSLIPFFEKLKKDGQSGKKKLTQYTRYLTLFLCTFQAIGMSKFIASSGAALNPNFSFFFVSTITLVTGTMFLMWLGEQITEKGIGNGISMIIFSNIVTGFPSSIGSMLESVRQGDIQIIGLLTLFIMLISIIIFVVFVERGQRKITVNYAKRQQGRNIYAAQKSHLPLKINMAGVIPPIFAMSVILFPVTIAQSFGNSHNIEFLINLGYMLSPGQPLYIFLFGISIIFFCFFYTSLVFNPKETADNLKKSGAFITGIRPGKQTALYIDKITTKLTVIGAMYITLVSLLPEILVGLWEVPFYFGGTSLLIIVVVIIDLIAQIQSYIMSHQYESLLKTNNPRKNT